MKKIALLILISISVFTLNAQSNHDECSICNGTGKCTHCAGMGDETCSACNGKGRESCSVCQGSGTLLKNGQSVTCYNCKGNRKVDCFRCKGTGKVTCWDCKGDWEMHFLSRYTHGFWWNNFRIFEFNYYRGT